MPPDQKWGQVRQVRFPRKLRPCPESSPRLGRPGLPALPGSVARRATRATIAMIFRPAFCIRTLRAPKICFLGNKLIRAVRAVNRTKKREAINASHSADFFSGQSVFLFLSPAESF